MRSVIHFVINLLLLLVDHKSLLTAVQAPSVYDRLHTELSQLKLSELMQRASNAGVDSQRVEEAMDAEDVKAAFVTLLSSVMQQEQVTVKECAKEHSEARCETTPAPTDERSRSSIATDRIDHEAQRHLKDCAA